MTPVLISASMMIATISVVAGDPMALQGGSVVIATLLIHGLVK